MRTTPTPPHGAVLIGLTGAAGSGKTAAAQHLQAAWDFEPLAFADPLRDMLAHMLADLGVDHAVLTEPDLKACPVPELAGRSARYCMQTLGDWGRALHPNHWVHMLAARAGLPPHGPAYPVHDRIVVTDVRFENEAAWLHAQGGRLLRLYRPQAQPVRPHASEQHWHTLPADAELHNNGATVHSLHDALDDLLQHTLGLEPRRSHRAPA